MFRRAALTLFLGISFAGLGFIPQKTFAQQAPSYRLEKINFVGSSRYSQDQLLAASGLRIGAAVSAQGFQDAATRLSQSGAFSEVKYRFNGAEAEYQLIDNPQFVPCTFENIVWMNDSELIAALRQKLPLFTGEVPLNGDLSNQVGQGIESVLKEKGIDASISVLPAANLNGPVKAMAYAAVTPRVEISQIEFRDASPAQIPTLEKATAALIGTEYRQSMLQDFASNQLRPIYLNQGYLHVDFGTAEAVPVATSAALAKVKITVPVREGAVYRLTALNWPGSDILPASSAPKMYLLKSGDVVNQDLLKKSLSNVGSAYFARGYLKANIKATPTFDETAHFVSYQIEVVPGELYRLRNVEFKNLSDAQLQKVRAAWKLQPGDIYDPTYAPSFLVKNRDSLRVLDGWSAIWTQRIYDDLKVVDLVMTFRNGTPVK